MLARSGARCCRCSRRLTASESTVAPIAAHEWIRLPDRQLTVIVDLAWRCLDDWDDERWDWNRVVYAHRHPEISEILYIGKADCMTVRERFVAPDRRKLLRRLRAAFSIPDSPLSIGFVYGLQRSTGWETPAHECVTEGLITDVESLLINQLQPYGNKQCREFRRPRPGLVVRCVGAWSGPNEFWDVPSRL